MHCHKYYAAIEIVEMPKAKYQVKPSRELFKKPITVNGKKPHKNET